MQAVVRAHTHLLRHIGSGGAREDFELKVLFSLR
jgi:hypothetical protein